MRTYVRPKSLLPGANLMQSSLLGLCAIDGVNWHVIAREAQHPGGLERLLRAELGEKSKDARETQKLIAAARRDLSSMVEHAAEEIRRAHEEVGARLVTVLDDEYPANLRVIYNLPPFLFYRGRLEREDARSVAVVGTRSASEEGIASAQRMACLLARAKVTVLSGLARGMRQKRGWAAIFGRVLVGYLNAHAATFRDYDLIVPSPTCQRQADPCLRRRVHRGPHAARGRAVTTRGRRHRGLRGRTGASALRRRVRGLLLPLAHPIRSSAAPAISSASMPKWR